MGREDDGSLSDRHADLAAEHLCKCLQRLQRIALSPIVDEHIGVAPCADSLPRQLHCFPYHLR